MAIDYCESLLDLILDDGDFDLDTLVKKGVEDYGFPLDDMEMGFRDILKFCLKEEFVSVTEDGFYHKEKDFYDSSTEALRDMASFSHYDYFPLMVRMKEKIKQKYDS
jgi:hypothetical protein